MWWLVYDSLFLPEAVWKKEIGFEKQGLGEKRTSQYQVPGKKAKRGEKGRETGKGLREEKWSIVANNMPIL